MTHLIDWTYMFHWLPHRTGRRNWFDYDNWGRTHTVTKDDYSPMRHQIVRTNQPAMATWDHLARSKDLSSYRRTTNRSDKAQFRQIPFHHTCTRRGSRHPCHTWLDNGFLSRHQSWNYDEGYFYRASLSLQGHLLCRSLVPDWIVYFPRPRSSCLQNIVAETIWSNIGWARWELRQSLRDKEE